MKVETLGYLDPGIRVPGEAIMKGRVWRKLRKRRELKGLSGQLELAPVSVRFPQGYSAKKGTKEKNGFLGPCLSSSTGSSFGQ